MVNVKKFEGDWQYHFIKTDKHGNITRTPIGTFHLDEIDAGTGKFTKARDDDGKTLTGGISKAGPLEFIEINRADPPKRHFRGINALEFEDGGVFCMVIVGERRKDPFLFLGSEDFKPEKSEAALTSQEDGVWIATKP